MKFITILILVVVACSLCYNVVNNESYNTYNHITSIKLNTDHQFINYAIEQTILTQIVPSKHIIHTITKMDNHLTKIYNLLKKHKIDLRDDKNFKLFWSPYFPIWGVYCGIWHTSYFGVKPVDQLDRSCQIHDICVTLETQGLSSCWCNEQLYYSASNIRITNETVSGIKDSILYYLYIATMRCKNWFEFNENIMLTKARDTEKTKGFNYLPFYPSHKDQQYAIRIRNDQINPNKANRTMIGTMIGSKFTYNKYQATIYEIDEKLYDNFAHDVFKDPTNGILKYNRYAVGLLGGSLRRLIIRKNKRKRTIIYNMSPENAITINIKNYTNCGETNTHDLYDNYYKNITISIGVIIIMGILLLCLVGCTILGYIYITKMKKEINELRNETVYDNIDKFDANDYP